MKKSLVTMAILLTLGLLTGAGSSPVHAAANCEDFLDNNVYRCQVKSEFGDEFDDCLRFNSATPSLSFEFDLFVDLLGDTLGCSCKETGSFKNPNFNAAKEWVCVSALSGATWGGKVAGSGKITTVDATFQIGDSFIFDCDLDPSCSVLGPPLTASSTGNPYTGK